MSRHLLIALSLLLAHVASAAGQSLAERSPNLQGVWGLAPADFLFMFAHRFEVMSGGDELISIPTLTLAAGLPLGLTAGVDFTSYSEVVPDNLTGNERQLWLKRPFELSFATVAAIAAYNNAAESFDGAIDLSVPLGRVRLFGEGRAFTDLFGMDDGGAAAAAGAAVQLTEYLSLTGDYGKVLTEDGIPGAWSGGLVVVIPASPHTLALIVTNSGATTLQGASREKVLGEGDVLYGFTFTVPLGGRGRWGRIFDPPTS